MNLCTTDNNCGVAFNDLGENGAVPKKSDYDHLSKIANTSVDELIKDNPSLLIFPQVLGLHDDGIGEEPIFNLHGNPEQPESVKLETGNLMGFIGIGDTQLKISSRFSKQDKNDHFMHYMLQKVFSINLLDYKYSSGDGGLDLLMFIFPRLLKKALAQGIFRQYQTFRRNDANVKGTIDVSRHIRENIPFGGKVSYNNRERTFDNPLTELVRHTIECIKTKSFGKDLLNADEEIKECVREIENATQGYAIHEREKVIAKNLKPIAHPYYTAYKPLQKLCLSILRHKKMSYGKSNSKAYGILFDGAWLWEEYLATVLVPAGFEHPQNKKGTGAIKIYNGNPRYPDFYKGKQITKSELNSEFISELSQSAKTNFVLDAKYKHLDNHKPESDEITASFSRDDFHQLITYMHIMPAKSGGLIYPYDKSDKQNSSEIIVSTKKTLYGYGGTVATYGVPIPSKPEYRDFVSLMNETERNIKESSFLKI